MSKSSKNTEHRINIDVLTLKLNCVEGDLEFDRFSFELSESRPYYCVRGPSGSGKTTFFKSLIPQFIEDWREHQHIDVDIRIVRNGLDFLGTNGRIGYSAQRPFFIAHKSVRVNLLVPFRWCGRPHPTKDQIESVIHDFALSNIIDRKAYMLSAGERQCLNLARMFIAGPELAIIDESFSSMDEALADQIAKVIVTKYTKDCRLLVTGHRSQDLRHFQPAEICFSFSDTSASRPVRNIKVVSNDEDS